MKTARAKLSSVSPYSQSKVLVTPKSRDETHEEHEQRCWRERCHTDNDGIVFIPPTAFKNCLAEAAKYKGIKIAGKGQERYTKHFEAGVMVVEPLSLGVHVDDIEGERLHVPSDGKRGGSKRVWKTFPVFREWSGTVEFLILDEIINPDVFLEHLTDAGKFIGVGRFRPRNNGYYGRFQVDNVTWN